MLAKLIYCSNCKELTLQLPQDKEQNEYKCNCGQTNSKPQTEDRPDDTNNTGQNEQEEG